MNKILSQKIQFSISAMDLENGPIAIALQGAFHIEGEPEFEKDFHLRANLGPEDVIRLKGFLMPILNNLKDSNGIQK